MYDSEKEKNKRFEAIKELESIYPGCAPFLSVGNECYSCCICNNKECELKFEEKFESPGRANICHECATTEEYLANYNRYLNPKKESVSSPKEFVNEKVKTKSQLAFERRQLVKVVNQVLSRRSLNGNKI